MEGIVSPRILRDGKTLGYVVRDVRTGRSLPLCAIAPYESPPSYPEGEKGKNPLTPNPSQPQEGEGSGKRMGNTLFFLAPHRKGGNDTEKNEGKTCFSSEPSGVAPFGGDRLPNLLGVSSLPTLPSPGREGQGAIFRFRRFFFSQRALDFGNAVLTEAAKRAEVIVVDEVGPLELSGRGFAPGLRLCRKSRAFLILTVRPHLLSAVRRWLNLENAEVWSVQGKGQE